MGLTTSNRTWEEATSPAALQLARRFEAAWRDAPPDRRPALREYLSDADALLPGARLALLRADMTLRWEAGERVDASWYRERLDPIGDDTLVALVYEEFCLREEADEDHPPDPDEYLTRYAEISPALRRVFDIHGLVGSAGQTTTGLHPSGVVVPPFPQAGETIAGFQLVEELGRGAFARVFLALERQLADRPVALKVSRTGSREPQTLARLQHTHIVPVHSYRTDPATGLHLLCMPYFGRLTLSRVLAEAKERSARTGADLLDALDRLGTSEPTASGRSTSRSALARRSLPMAIAWWGARMAEALEHAHDRGVLHRDVKPSNVLVTADGMPMLLDFNLAREVIVEEEEAGSAIPGGTLDYMAPEHLEELADGLSDRIDARSDVFGLGVLLFEALAGSRPFPAPKGASSATELLLRAADARRAGPPSLRDACPDVPAALAAVVRKCLMPDPDDRYTTAAEMAADLNAVADDRSLKFASEPILNRTGRWVRRHRRFLATATPVALALGLIGWQYERQRFEGRERLWQAGGYYDVGAEALDHGEPLKAMDQLGTSTALASKSGTTLSGSNKGTRTTAARSALFNNLEALGVASRKKYAIAVLMRDCRNDADAVFEAGRSLRFRLTGFGGDLRDTANDLRRVMSPFNVLGGGDVWIGRTNVQELLDKPRRERLVREVNDLLFLWALRLGEPETPDYDPAFAAKLCDLALTFATPPGPWRALRDRVRGVDPSIAEAVPADESSALGCFQWGALSLSDASSRGGRRGPHARLAAIRWFDQAVKREPGNAFFEYYLGYAYDDDGRGGGSWTQAANHYYAAISLAPTSPWPRFSRARLYSRHGRLSEAAEEFRVALASLRALPESQRDATFETQTRLELGVVCQQLGDFDSARADFEAVIVDDPDAVYARAARLNLAKIDADAGRTAKARAEFDELVAAQPADHAARLARALLALRAGNAERATSDLTELLSPGGGAGPDAEPSVRGEILAHRAVAALNLGRPEEAAKDAEEARRLIPGPSMERLHARVCVALGRTDGLTISRPEDLAALPLNGRRLWVDLRRLANRLRQDADSRLVAAPSTVNGPSTAATAAVAGSLRSRQLLAVILAALGDPAAVIEAERAVRLYPGTARPYLTRAMVLRQRGRIADSLRDVNFALSLEPDEPRAWALLGELLVASGEPKKGLVAIDRAIALGDEGMIRGARASALLASGNAHGAVRDWSLALAVDPENPAGYLGRAEAFIALRDWDSALADVEKAAGWFDARPGLGLKIALAYARCLPARPDRFPRLVAMLRRVAEDSLHNASPRAGS